MVRDGLDLRRRKPVDATQVVKSLENLRAMGGKTRWMNSNSSMQERKVRRPLPRTLRAAVVVHASRASHPAPLPRPYHLQVVAPSRVVDLYNLSCFLVEELVESEENGRSSSRPIDYRLTVQTPDFIRP